MLGCTTHDLQLCLISFVHRTHYNPTHPPTKTPYSRISVAERERLEIYGDALLKWRLVSFLLSEYPAQPPRFISRVAAAMLSNWLFTNIFLKAEGVTISRGYALDKPIADRFETMCAQYYIEVGPCPEFDAWFLDTFRPLVVEAEVFLSRLEVQGGKGSRGIKSRPRQEDVPGPTLPAKRGWAEAMEEAGNQPESNWLRAMMADDKRNVQAGKENSNPSLEEPYRSRKCWDVPFSKPLGTVSPVKSSVKPAGLLLGDPLDPNLSLADSPLCPMRKLEFEASREDVTERTIVAADEDADMDPMLRLELAVLRERATVSRKRDEEADMDPMARLELDVNAAADSSIVHISEWPVVSDADLPCGNALPDFEDATVRCATPISEETVRLSCWSVCSSPMSISPSSSPASAPAIFTSLHALDDLPRRFPQVLVTHGHLPLLFSDENHIQLTARHLDEYHHLPTTVKVLPWKVDCVQV